jgi:hypothetical protein
MSLENTKLLNINHILKTLVHDESISGIYFEDNGKTYNVIVETSSPINESIEVENRVLGIIEDINKKWIKIDKEIESIDLIYKKTIKEQYTTNDTISILKDYSKIKFTGNTKQNLGLSDFETPKSLLYKINNNPNFTVKVFDIVANGNKLPVYRLLGKGQFKGKTYEINLRPEKGNNFALIGSIKIPIN